jgi:hypothetical protein
MGKPRYDYVVDDRSVFYRADPAEIEAFVKDKARAGVVIGAHAE